MMTQQKPVSNNHSTNNYKPTTMPLYAYDVVHMAMANEQKILGDCSLRASTDVKRYLEGGKYDASLLPSDR